MNLFTRITATATRVIRTVVEAPAVSRQLAELRNTTPATTPATRLVEVDIDLNDVPAVADIEAAAKDFETARQEANAAARLRRRADRVLKRVPNGTHGTVTVQRVESSRQTADLDAIKAVFAELGRDVPMKTCSPSITLTWVADEQAHEDTAPFLAAA